MSGVGGELEAQGWCRAIEHGVGYVQGIAYIFGIVLVHQACRFQLLYAKVLGGKHQTFCELTHRMLMEHRLVGSCTLSDCL